MAIQAYDQDILMRITDIMDYLQLSHGTIYRYIQAGEFPRHLEKKGQVVYWNTEEVKKWKEKSDANI